MSNCVAPKMLNVPGSKAGKCDYCQAERAKQLFCVDQYVGFEVCAEHEPLGLRDMRAWYHRNGLVLIEDLLEFCPELAAIKPGSVVWEDALGRRRGGGSILRSGVFKKVFLSQYGESAGGWRKSGWAVPVDTHSEYTGIVSVPLAELLLMPGLTKTIAEQVNVRLSLGFYKEDVAAYFAAAEAKWAEDQASTDPTTQDRVAKVIANLRGGRESSAAHYNVNYVMPEAFRTV